MEIVTIDTNILPLGTLEEAATQAGYSFAVVSVTHRELEGTDLSGRAKALETIPETMVFDESCWGSAVLGDLQDSDNLEAILNIISSGSFPKPAARNNLTAPQRNQLRDAMILQSHVRTGRACFVSKDGKAYVKHGKREDLERRFGIRIFTPDEFIEHCHERIHALGSTTNRI